MKIHRPSRTLLSIFDPRLETTFILRLKRICILTTCNRRLKSIFNARACRNIDKITCSEFVLQVLTLKLITVRVFKRKNKIVWMKP